MAKVFGSHAHRGAFVEFYYAQRSGIQRVQREKQRVHCIHTRWNVHRAESLHTLSGNHHMRSQCSASEADDAVERVVGLVARLVATPWRMSLLVDVRIVIAVLVGLLWRWRCARCLLARRCRFCCWRLAGRRNFRLGLWRLCFRLICSDRRDRLWRQGTDF